MRVVIIVLFVYLLITAVELLILEFRSGKILSTLTGKYMNGIFVDCFGVEELAGLISQVMAAEIVLDSNYVVVKEKKLKVKFYLENQRIFAVYPTDNIGFSSLFMRINGFMRIKKLRKVVLANEIMDKIALNYQPNEFVQDEGSYEKAKKISSNMRYSYIGAFLAVLVFVIIFSLNSENEKIKLVKYGRPEAFPDKTYDAAFKDFFNKTNWKYFQADNGEEVVEFTGFIKEKEEKKENKIYIQFIIDKGGKYFELGAMKLGDEVQSEFMKYVVMGVIFSGRDNVLNNLSEKDMEETISDSVEEELRILEEERKKDKKKREQERKTREQKRKAKKEASTEIESDVPFEREENSLEAMQSEMEFILPESDKRYLTEEEIFNLGNKGTLRFARNEIYARYGRMFKSEDLQKYFNSLSWYQPLIEADSFDESVLNDFEKANIQLIKQIEPYAPEGEFDPDLY